MSRSSDWDPLRVLTAVRDRMNRLFEAALTRSELEAEGGIGPWVPLADVRDEDDEYRVFVELPGLEQDHIRVRIDGDDLVVEGERPAERDRPGVRFHRVERSSGKFGRRFRLPGAVDRDSVTAHYRLGVLEIALAKRPKPGPARISVSID